MNPVLLCTRKSLENEYLVTTPGAQVPQHTQLGDLFMTFTTIPGLALGIHLPPHLDRNGSFFLSIFEIMQKMQRNIMLKTRKTSLPEKKKLSMIGIYFTSWCIFPTLQALSFSPPMKQLKLQAAREQSAFIQRCFTVNGTAIYKNHFFHSGHVLLCLYRDIFFNLEHKLN